MTWCRVAVLTFMVVAAVLPALAQGGHTMAVEVPFAFTVGDEQFAAGRYTVDTGFTAAVALYDPRGVGRFVPTPSAIVAVGKRGCEPRLVFDRFAHEYFLVQIWSCRGGQMVLPGDKHRQMLSSIRPAKVTIAAAR